MGLGQVGGGAQVARGHQVGEHVVVGHRAVFVGTGDAVDAEVARGVVVPEGAPQAGRLDQQLDARAAREGLIVGRRQVAGDRVGDVGVDVKGGGAGRPVARALVAADRPPGEGGALQAQGPRPVAGQLERPLAPAQGVGGGGRRRVGEHREHEHLGVPERVAVVAGAGQALGRDRALLTARAGLQRVKEGEAHRLLQLGVTLELDVGVRPELIQVGRAGRRAGRPSRGAGRPRRPRRPGPAAPGTVRSADQP